MNKFSKLILTCGLLFFLLSGYAQKAIVQTDSLVTILQSRQYKIHSNALGRDMMVKVRFPDDYEKTGKKYPVLYLLDGDPFFAAATDIVHYLEWGNMMPQVIIVSPAYGTLKQVENGGTNYRSQDFDIESDDAHPERFYQFLTEELIPFADKKFRTEPSDRCLWGYSMGADFGSYTLFHDKQPFNRIILLEPYPSILLTLEKQYHETNRDMPVKLFDGYGISTLANMQVIDSLKSRHYKNLSLYAVQLKNISHLSIPAEGFTLGLKAVYNKKSSLDALFPIYSEKGISATIEKYNNLVTDPEKDNYNWDRLELDQLGGAILNLGNAQDAITIYKLNASLHPDDAEAFCTLGWAYQNLSDKKTSIEYFEKARKLDPKNMYALERLQKVDKAVAYWGLLGSATKNGWDGPGINFSEDKTKKGIWVLKNVQLTDGEIKFRFNNDWRINLGNDEKGKFVNGGENIKIQAGSYDITLDLTDDNNPKSIITKL